MKRNGTHDDFRMNQLTQTDMAMVTRYRFFDLCANNAFGFLTFCLVYSLYIRLQTINNHLLSEISKDRTVGVEDWNLEIFHGIHVDRKKTGRLCTTRLDSDIYRDNATADSSDSYSDETCFVVDFVGFSKGDNGNLPEVGIFMIMDYFLQND
ncbi:hypothetical protein NQ317_005327, partial [Molorchus minor]